MSDTVIRVENLGKKYIIGHQQQPYKTLRDVMANGVRSLRHQLLKPFGKSGPNSAYEEFWALKDISFEIKPGEVVGIIGRNGAGKSTLLKILSRITEPTNGRISIKGRVASLLEVGTGFHPELTGRENIYLNGAILGMSKAEIKKKFDEIVTFAEVERFLDTPVKRYSSGMYVRLAFAVAAHLEPEILVVDEVLAVGDTAFQKKCLGKMGDVATKEGRTVLFVSHNMHAVSLLCSRAILLRSGQIESQGSTSHVISQYLSSATAVSSETSWSFDEAPGNSIVKLCAVRILNHEQKVCFDVDIDRPITIEMEFLILQRTRINPVFDVCNQQGILLFSVSNLHDEDWATKEYEPGHYKCSCQIPGNFLNEGQHYISAFLRSDINSGYMDVRKEELLAFRVNDNGSSRGDYVYSWQGLVRPILPWNVSCIDNG